MMQEQNINAVIDHLAAKLSVPTAHLWGVLQRQVIVDAMQCGIFAALLGVSFGLFLSRRAKVHAWAAEESFDGGLGLTFYYAGTVASLAGGMLLLVAALGRVMNPEYYALSDILSALK